MIRLELKEATITEGLRSLSDLLDDLTPVMGRIGEFLVASTKERFQEGKGPDGSTWAPKSAATLAAYRGRKDRVSTRPLIGPSGELSSKIFAEIGPTSVAVGSNQIYAAVMQFGAAQGAFGARAGRTRPSAKRPKGQDYFFPIPWGNIPARPFLGISDEDRTGILEIVEEWLMRAAGDR